ncbi:hypothetical protein OKW96_05680 [Sphingobacterium sp. KU25419]|nr:hypothetical protein OKW96_05680 [Sphingobacterium sp. KU25419]
MIDLNTQVDKVADLNQLLRRSPGVTIREDGEWDLISPLKSMAWMPKSLSMRYPWKIMGAP